MTRLGKLLPPVVGLLALALAGCGFHPLYGERGDKTDPALNAVYVDIIPNRNGQLLRQALQARLNTDESLAKKYELSVAYAFTGEGIGVQSDNSSDRTRYVGTAYWTLRAAGPQGAKITSGSARQLDGANVLNAQFFYADLASDAINRRMSEALADQIVQSLAVYFRAHPQGA